MRDKVKIAGVQQTWTPDNFVDMTVADLKSKIGAGKVVLGLSGGVDSTVAAVLLNKAIAFIPVLTATAQIQPPTTKS